ncbi:hypothetical protein [Micromonospora zhanjiangensis]|uniref:Uncharacterized protein n=1 Tax=Micromonospora zhanjiangensis TaxID=1522057 RepID=A0ABV8KTK8_9ACTN
MGLAAPAGAGGSVPTSSDGPGAPPGGGPAGPGSAAPTVTVGADPAGLLAAVDDGREAAVWYAALP